MDSTSPKLNLVVIRSSNLEAAQRFYNHLGIYFDRHKHGKGLEHLASEVEGNVFEIYPATKSSPVSSSTRIGFLIQEIESKILNLESVGGRVITKTHESAWGQRSVIADPDGHKIELISPHSTKHETTD